MVWFDGQATNRSKQQAVQDMAALQGKCVSPHQDLSRHRASLQTYAAPAEDVG